MPDSPPSVSPSRTRNPSAHDDEARLAQRALEGDGEAFATLYDRHERSVYNFCFRLTGSPDDAADATQESFLRMLKRLPEMDASRELNFGAYLLTVARHASYELIEKRRRTQPTEDIPETAGPVGGGSAPEPGDPSDDPDRAVLLDAQQEEIRAANARLPERQREVLALRELEELSYDEIATVMEMNRNSVAQLISRARIGLAGNLRIAAAEAVAAASPECERALPLLALRQDGEPETEVSWLDSHLATCASCQVRVEAMAEAGVSYRAWLPLVPIIALRKETIAHAAELVGADWTKVAERGRPGSSRGNIFSRTFGSFSFSRRDWALAAVTALAALLVVLAVEVGESPLPDVAPAAEEIPVADDPPADTTTSDDKPAKNKAKETDGDEPPAPVDDTTANSAPTFTPESQDEPASEPRKKKKSTPKDEDEPAPDTTETTPTPPPPPPTDTTPTPTTPEEPPPPPTETDPPRPDPPPQCFDPNGRPIPCPPPRGPRG